MLFASGAVVSLPPRVLAVLGRLLERPGELVTKRRLTDAVWGDTSVTEESLIEAIKLLRKALSDNSKDPAYIQTVHRRGYRFIAPVTEASSAVACAADDPRSAVGNLSRAAVLVAIVLMS